MPDVNVANKVFANLLLVALGYLIKRIGLLKREDGRVLNRLVLYVTLPAMNLKVITNSELSWNLFLLPAIMFVGGVLISQVGTLPAKALKLNKPDTGTFVVSLCGTMLSMAYPFMEAGWGEEGVRYTAIADQGNAIAIFAVAYYLSYRYSNRDDFSTGHLIKRLVTFFPLQTFVLAFVLNLLNVQFTGLPGTFIDSLASLNSALMLLSLGVYLELDFSRSELKILGVHFLYKYIMGLLVSLLVITVLPLKGTARAVAFLLPLMPSSLSTLLYSVEQELNSRLAAMVISFSMLVSLALTTVVILWFRTAF